jgi:hypothetical protein
LLGICSCSCMSRSSMCLGLACHYLGVDCLGFPSHRWPSSFPWHHCYLKVCRHKS